jgi:hypothetical protein
MVHQLQARCSPNPYLDQRINRVDVNPGALVILRTLAAEVGSRPMCKEKHTRAKDLHGNKFPGAF